MEIGTQKQLLVDDFVVEDVWNLRRVVVRPAKHHDNPVLVADHPWEHSGHPGQDSKGLHANCVMFDAEEGLFKMWYNSSHITSWKSERENWYTYWIGYATSKDGLVWEKPDLGLFEFDGSRKNNVVFTGEWWATCGTVLKEADEADPARRYKLLYTDVFGVEDRNMIPTEEVARKKLRPGVCMAFSPDGVHWTPYEGNPVIDGESDTSNVCFWDITRERYVLFMRPLVYAGRWKRRIARAESPDLLQWSLPETVLFPDELDPVELYGMPVFPYEGIYFGLLQMYYSNTTMNIDTQLAFSRDSEKWDRLPTREPFLERGIRHGQGVEFDAGMVFPLPPVTVGDELWFYYTGHNADHMDPGQRESAIGLATSKRDRLVGREPVRQDAGILLTRPFPCEGDELVINASCPNGRIQTEVLSEQGAVLDGYGRQGSVAFDGDSLQHTMKWSGRGLHQLRNTVIRLKLYITNATLYAFQVQEVAVGSTCTTAISALGSERARCALAESDRNAGGGSGSSATIRV